MTDEQITPTDPVTPAEPASPDLVASPVEPVPVAEDASPDEPTPADYPPVPDEPVVVPGPANASPDEPTPLESPGFVASPVEPTDEADTQAEDVATAQDAQADNIAAALAPITGDNPSPELQARVAQVQAGVTPALAVSPAPTMVNGVSIVGKKLHEDGTRYVDDPDAPVAEVGRKADFFDRIGQNIQHEGTRSLLEEMFHWVLHLVGKKPSDLDTTVLPPSMPEGKSTASLRQDVQGSSFGAPAGAEAAPAAATTDTTSAKD